MTALPQCTVLGAALASTPRTALGAVFNLSLLPATFRQERSKRSPSARVATAFQPPADRLGPGAERPRRREGCGAPTPRGTGPGAARRGRDRDQGRSRSRAREEEEEEAVPAAPPPGRLVPARPVTASPPEPPPASSRGRRGGSRHGRGRPQQPPGAVGGAAQIAEAEGEFYSKIWISSQVLCSCTRASQLNRDFSTSVNDIQINKTKPQWHNYFLCGLKGIQVELAEICTKSERYIGTEGGGMDQSISFLAEEGTLLSKSKGLDWKKMLRLQDVQAKLGVSLEEMLTIVEEVLHPEPYSTEEICKCLGISLEDLRSQILSQNTQDVSTFKLHQRAKHVYSEAARVLEFKKICNEAPANAIQLLGELMNQSYISCREMYECSCPELDRLVDICLQFGAVGSRLTGAGWGGCTVSMVPTDKLNTFLKNVKKAYYQNDVQRLALENNSLFATKPGRGALVFVEA
ncbi:N-acetylgalactosamine kinase isoform X4 [Cygnus olor]|uniref:N-acetylgalactosamine kinase isoform X4 n=1 Tax=Cygnus olor TaxID=8869 RepID=UPI001ADE7AF7|nr:N-acetylgalactosamine kinase isoform X4 [Cygnus olor]